MLSLELPTPLHVYIYIYVEFPCSSFFAFLLWGGGCHSYVTLCYNILGSILFFGLFSRLIFHCGGDILASSYTAITAI